MEKQNQDLRAIFDSFDKDKSGSIEKNEVKVIATQHGHNVTQEELAEMFNEIDINGDGKISFDEFKLCWNYGIVGKMRNLVVMQGKAMQLGSFCSEFLKSSSVDHKIESNNESYTYEVEYDSKDPHFSISVSGSVKGQKLKKKLDNLAQTVPGFNPEMTNLVLTLTFPNPSEVKAIIDKQIHKAEEEAKKNGIPIEQLAKYKVEVGPNNTLNFILSTTEDSQFMVEMQMAQVYQSLEMFGKDFFFDFSTKADLDGSLIQLQQCKNLIDALLLGFKFSFNLETTLNVVKMMKQLSKAPEQVVNSPIFQSQVFKRVLSSPQDLEKFLNQNGINEHLSQAPAPSILIKKASDSTSKAKQGTHKHPNTITANQVMLKLFSGQLFKLDLHVTTPIAVLSLGIALKNPKQFAKAINLI